MVIITSICSDEPQLQLYNKKQLYETRDVSENCFNPVFKEVLL